MAFQAREMNHQEIAHFFSNSFIKKLVRTGDSLDVTKTAADLGFYRYGRVDSLLEKYNFFYEILCSNYRNEYVFKNVLTAMVLDDTHSIDDSVVLPEFRAASCKADLVVVNGSAAVYEIKTDLDTFDRLAFQVESYRKVFENIYVVTTPKQEGRALKLVSEDIGVVTIDDDNQVTTIRKSSSNKDNIIPDIVFDSLRKDEYLRIISEYYGSVVDVPNTQIYDICKAMFCRIPKDFLQYHIRRVLKQRGESLKSFLEMVPPVFKGFAAAASLSRNEQRGFLELL